MAGPLHPLLALPLKDLDTATIEAWAQREGQHRPTSARLAWRLLRAFLSWCAEHPEYKAIVPAQNPAKSRRAREALGKAGVKSDALLKEQLPAWFAAVHALPAAPAAYLQTLLLTGARPGELLGLRWDDINVQWRGLTIRDKVEGERVIPLTPYVHHLLGFVVPAWDYQFNPRDTDSTFWRHWWDERERYVATGLTPAEHDAALAQADAAARRATDAAKVIAPTKRTSPDRGELVR